MSAKLYPAKRVPAEFTVPDKLRLEMADRVVPDWVTATDTSLPTDWAPPL